MHHPPPLTRIYRDWRLRLRRSNSSWRKITDKRWSTSELTSSSRLQRLRSDLPLSSSCCSSDCRMSQALKHTTGDDTVKGHDHKLLVSTNLPHCYSSKIVLHRLHYHITPTKRQDLIFILLLMFKDSAQFTFRLPCISSEKQRSKSVQV